MALKFKRNKKRNLKLSLLYRLSKALFFLKPECRLKFYLDLEWIFWRLAHEETSRIKSDIKTLDFLLRHINGTDKVLDLGCGEGRSIKGISNITTQITGVDLDKKRLKIAQKENDIKNIHFIYNDVMNYVKEIKQNDFDAAILSHIIEHLDNPEELLRILSKKVAKIYIEVPDFESTILNLFRLELDMDLRYADADHIYEFNRDELKKLLDKCNLDIIDSDFRFGLIKMWCRPKCK